MSKDRDSSSPELEAVTLRPSDVEKLKETVKTFQNVLGGISKESNGRENPVPGLSGLRSSITDTGQDGERKKGTVYLSTLLNDMLG